jgi:hypothetical protein
MNHLGRYLGTCHLTTGMAARVMGNRHVFTQTNKSSEAIFGSRPRHDHPISPSPLPYGTLATYLGKTRGSARGLGRGRGRGRGHGGAGQGRAGQGRAGHMVAGSCGSEYGRPHRHTPLSSASTGNKQLVQANPQEKVARTRGGGLREAHSVCRSDSWLERRGRLAAILSLRLCCAVTIHTKYVNWYVHGRFFGSMDDEVAVRAADGNLRSPRLFFFLSLPSCCPRPGCNPCPTHYPPRSASASGRVLDQNPTTLAAAPIERPRLRLRRSPAGVSTHVGPAYPHGRQYRRGGRRGLLGGGDGDDGKLAHCRAVQWYRGTRATLRIKDRIFDSTFPTHAERRRLDRGSSRALVADTYQTKHTHIHTGTSTHGRPTTVTMTILDFAAKHRQAFSSLFMGSQP